MRSKKKTVEEIFHAALEIASTAERTEFIKQSCAESSSLQARVEKLLAAYREAEEFLEQSPNLAVEEPSRVVDDGETMAPVQRRFHIDEQLPRRFGDYELLKKIAHGGMGVVFKARQLSLNRPVAIKMILSGQFAGPDEVRRFQIEAEAAGTLDHSGIVPVYDVGCQQGQHYFSMALVEGSSLSTKIKEGSLLVRESVSIAKKIAVAMQAAHDRGIVHRDLKPGNVLLDENNQPRVTDFGLAKQVEGDSQLTKTGMVLGTPSFMPPEQAAGKKIDAAADVYSIGAILYAMLTGVPPFEGETQLETILHVLQDEPVSLRKIDKKIPRDLEAICLKSLEKKPADRYQTAAELAADLERFLSGEPIQAKNDLKRRFRKWTLREPVLAAHLMASLVMLVIIVINYLILRDRGIGREYNFRGMQTNIGVLGVWALIVFALQKAQNIYQTKSAIPFVWAAINPVFMTLIICWNEAPRGLLFSLYFLLIVSSCFFRRVQIVAITTLFSLVGYSIVVFFYLTPLEETAPGYLIVTAVNLAISGTLLGFLALRMKRLGDQKNQ